MERVLKTYGPLRAASAAPFEAYLAEVVGPNGYTRRGAGGDVYFDAHVAPSPLVDLELQNLVTAERLPQLRADLARAQPWETRETRINVFDNSRAGSPWSPASGLNKRRARSLFDPLPWSVF